MKDNRKMNIWTGKAGMELFKGVIEESSNKIIYERYMKELFAAEELNTMQTMYGSEYTRDLAKKIIDSAMKADPIKNKTYVGAITDPIKKHILVLYYMDLAAQIYKNEELTKMFNMLQSDLTRKLARRVIDVEAKERNLTSEYQKYKDDTKT